MFNTFLFNTSLFNGQGLSVGDADQEDFVFNGYGLQNASVTVTEFIGDNMPSRALDVQDVPRGNGQVLLNDFWRKKTITMRGYIRKTSNSALEAEIDLFKKAMSQRRGILDVKKDGVIRRHIATLVNSTVFDERKGYHITLVPFSLEFECLTPFGTSKSYESTSFLDQTDLTLNDQVVNDGTAEATPVLTVNFSAASSITAVQFTNNTTGETITVAHAFSAGDYLRIDAETKEVTLNGVAVDYTGAFPRILSGTNSISLTITGSSATYSHTVKFLTPYL